MTTYDFFCGKLELGKLNPWYRDFEILHHPEIGIFSYAFLSAHKYVLFDYALSEEPVVYPLRGMASITTQEIIAKSKLIMHDDFEHLLQGAGKVRGTFRITKLPCNPSFYGISFKSVPQDLAAVNYLANLGNYKCDEIMEVLRRSYIWTYFRAPKDICQLIINKVLLLRIERLDKELC